jgi:hypothetical protein
LKKRKKEKRRGSHPLGWSGVAKPPPMGGSATPWQKKKKKKKLMGFGPCGWPNYPCGGQQAKGGGPATPLLVFSIFLIIF